MKLLSVLVGWVVCSMATAMELPNVGFLFIASNIPPADVFRNGLQAVGQNADLIAHASGVSCERSGAAASRYLQARSAYYVAGHEARVLTARHLNEDMYVYYVRSTRRWFNLATTLERLQRETAAGPSIQGLISLSQMRSAWITDEPIERREIYAVDIFRNGVEIEHRRNLHYDNSLPEIINNAPYIPVDDQGDHNNFDQLVVVNPWVFGVACAYACNPRGALFLSTPQTARPEGFSHADTMYVRMPVGQVLARELLPILMFQPN
jgi:hypothetical protein